MRTHRPVVSALVGVLWVLSAGLDLAAQAPDSAPGSALTCEEMETFLRTAKIERRRDLPVGITVPARVTLFDGKLRHDAALQTTDVRKFTHETAFGTELNFRDSWQFNVAGYELAKQLGLNMVPPYVERNVSGTPGSLSWWVADAMMERDRFQKKIEPPDPRNWNQEMYAARVFHELIGDTDFNMTNMLITKDWRLWMIDFSRAFRLTKKLHSPKSLRRIDRKLLAGLRGLTAGGLQELLGRWLNRTEREALLARRDLIVRFFDDELAAKGETVLYDFARTSEPCGAGLQ